MPIMLIIVLLRKIFIVNDTVQHIADCRFSAGLAADDVGGPSFKDYHYDCVQNNLSSLDSCAADRTG